MIYTDVYRGTNPPTDVCECLRLFFMGIEYKTSIKKLTAANTGTNYVELLSGTGSEFVTNFFVTAEIKNTAMAAYVPPPPPGLQYEADRQVQLRLYAEEASQIRLDLYMQVDGQVFKKKTVPLFKIFPDHTVDLYPLLWATDEAPIGTIKLLCSLNPDFSLPTTQDEIIVSVDYYKSNVNSNTWFTLPLTANTETFIQLPDNCYYFEFKQINGTMPLKWGFNPGILTGSNHDILNVEFEENLENVNNNKVYFACEVSTVVLVKAWS
jgi:hypothetical protein